MKKGVDRCFLNYGIRQEDMNLIENACQTEGIDFEWLKEQVLKPFYDEKNNANMIEEKKLRSILNKALKRVQGSCAPVGAQAQSGTCAPVGAQAQSGTCAPVGAQAQSGTCAP